MKRIVPMIVLVAAVAVIACSSRSFENSLTTETQMAPDVTFAAYHTWKFAREDEYPATGIAALDDPAFRENVGRHMVTEMQNLGYSKVDADPDFVLMIHFISENKFDEQKMNDIYQGYDMAWAQMSDEDYWKEGTLMLFAMDAKTGKQVWRGVARAHLEEASTMDTKKTRFKKVLTMMLEDFPPAGK